MSLYASVVSEARDPLSHQAFKYWWDQMEHGERTDSSARRTSHDHVPPRILRLAHEAGLIHWHTANGAYRGVHSWTKIDPERKKPTSESASLYAKVFLERHGDYDPSAHDAPRKPLMPPEPTPIKPSRRLAGPSERYTNPPPWGSDMPAHGRVVRRALVRTADGGDDWVDEVGPQSQRERDRRHREGAAAMRKKLRAAGDIPKFR